MLPSVPSAWHQALSIVHPPPQGLVKAGVKYVAEGANMPSEADAIKVYHDNKILFGPAKVRQPGVCVAMPGWREVPSSVDDGQTWQK